MKSSAYPPFPPNTHTIDTPSHIFTKKSWSAPRSDFSKITTPPIYKGGGGGVEVRRLGVHNMKIHRKTPVSESLF